MSQIQKRREKNSNGLPIWSDNYLIKYEKRNFDFIVLMQIAHSTAQSPNRVIGLEKKLLFWNFDRLFVQALRKFAMQWLTKENHFISLKCDQSAQCIHSTYTQKHTLR